MAGVDHISVGAIKSKAAIAKEYRRLKLTPQPADTWVEDRRTGNLIGPFSVKGERMRDELNQFVARNVAQLDAAEPFVLVDRDGVIVR